MSGAFLVFFPKLDRDKLTVEIARATWLADVWPDELRTAGTFVRVTKHFVQSGPDGSSGLIACLGAPDQQPVGYYPERQTWQQFGGHWLGFDNVNRPSPESLQRANLISGYDVELGDHQTWHVPIIRRIDQRDGRWSHNLPRVMGLDAEMHYAERLRPDIAWAWELACEVWDQYYSVGMMPDRIFHIAVRFLGLNYRLGQPEVAMLGLLDTQRAGTVLDNAIDSPSCREWMAAEELKKNQSGVGT